MEAQISEIGTIAGRAAGMLANPTLIAATALTSLALISGTAARGLELIENHMPGRSRRSR